MIQNKIEKEVVTYREPTADEFLRSKKKRRKSKSRSNC